VTWDIRLDLGALDIGAMGGYARMDAIEKLVDAVVHVNRLWLPTHPRTPPLYSSGVVYAPDDSAFDPGLPNFWRDIPRTLELGHGHCVALAAWRVAELREKGEKAKIRIDEWHERIPGSVEFHIHVLRGNGTIEDPARRLGMP
jgi:hypothetical protein